MKTVNQIISHIVKKPQYQKISSKRCFMKVIKLLPPHLSRAVLFTYTKNKTLFIVLNHPGLKMEFHYKDNLIKSLLKQIKSIDIDCQNMEDIRDIKYFVSNKIEKKSPPAKPLTFKEKASGDFSILTENKKLYELFQKIKSTIKANHDNS
jgi:hypothetical protein